MVTRRTFVCGATVAGTALLVGENSAASAGRVVTYEEFGAVGDGKADDMAAVAAAHAAANERHLPVRAGDGKTYYLGKGEHTAVIRTDVDFGKAKFIIDDVGCKNKSVFVVASSLTPIDIRDQIKSLKAGQESIDVKLTRPCLVAVADARVKQYIRFGANQNNGTAKQEVFLVSRNGKVHPRTPIVWDYDGFTSAKAIPLDEGILTIKGGVFVTIANQAESKYHYHTRNIAVQRGNVVISGLRHEIVGEKDHGAPYGGFISISHCANVRVEHCVFTGHKIYRTIGSAGRPVSMGSYDLSVNSSVRVSFVHCRQTTDILNTGYWGLLGSNFCKDLLFDDCQFSRFDAHMGVANATIRNSTLGHQGINAIGFGTFLVEKSTVYGHNFINLRSDYGSTWRGDFIIRDCEFVPAGGKSAVGCILGGYNSGRHDFGYHCSMPRRLVVDGLKIDDSKHPEKYDGPFIFGEFNAANKSADYKENFPYEVTHEVVLRKVVTTSGRPLQRWRNQHMFAKVAVSSK